MHAIVRERFVKSERSEIPGSDCHSGPRTICISSMKNFLCGHEIPGTLDVRQRVIARDRVRYVGQPVALIVAVNRYVAEDAAALVEIGI